MLKQIRKWLAAMLGMAFALPIMSQSTDVVRNAARGEGVVRFAVFTCFVSGSPEQNKLNAQSARYVRSLSSASGVPVAELEKLVADGLANAKSTKKISVEQCKKGRDATIKLLNDRDAGLAI